VQRLFVLWLFIGAAVVAAGLFGALHNQISYSVSAEYFTKFKFLQFQLLDASVPERLRAAEVGFLASWWMGLLLGPIVGIVGFAHRTPTSMQRGLMLSLPVILGCVALAAVVGLVVGYVSTSGPALELDAGWFVPPGLGNPRAFVCAGYMHNASYIGAVAAVPVAWAFNLLLRRRWGVGT
jgi:hypothetical protein